MATFNEIAWLILQQNDDQRNENVIPNNRLQTKRDDIVDPFTILERLFVKNFRLPNNVARFLIDMLAPYVKIQSRSSAVSLNTKVLIALHFFGTGSYQSPVGNSRFTSVSQPTISRCVEEIVSALNHPEIFSNWIKFPSNMQELTEVRNGMNFLVNGRRGRRILVHLRRVRVELTEFEGQFKEGIPKKEASKRSVLKRSMSNSTNASVSSDTGPPSKEKIMVTPPKRNGAKAAAKVEEASGDESSEEELVPEKIIGSTRASGQLKFVLKWKGIEEAYSIPDEIANEKYPNLVIQFYIENLVWSAPVNHNRMNFENGRRVPLQHVFRVVLTEIEGQFKEGQPKKEASKRSVHKRSMFNSTNASVSSDTGPPSKEKIMVTPPKRNGAKAAAKVEEASGDESSEEELVPEKIIGSTRASGQLKFVLKWKGIEESYLIPAEIANEKYPKLVIQFYQEHLVWSAPVNDNRFTG